MELVEHVSSSRMGSSGARLEMQFLQASKLELKDVWANFIRKR